MISCMSYRSDIPDWLSLKSIVVVLAILSLILVFIGLVDQIHVMTSPVIELSFTVIVFGAHRAVSLSVNCASGLWNTVIAVSYTHLTLPTKA